MDHTRDATSMRRFVVGHSVIFGLVLTVASLALCRWWLDVPFGSLFTREHLFRNLLTGAALGGSASTITLLIFFRMPTLHVFRRLVREGFDGLEPGVIHLVMIACVAGWSEELFFRGILQAKIGIGLAALAFVIQHGQVRLVNWRKVSLALALFASGVALGYTSRILGLEAAMAAHAGYNLVVLFVLYVDRRKRKTEPEPF